MRLIIQKVQLISVVAYIFVMGLAFLSFPGQALAAGNTCGGGAYASVHTDFNFGCKGKGNAIMDLIFAIVRFLSTGVGLVLVGSMIWGGIQYTGSRGDPQATALAVKRIRANIIALLLFVFAYALLNFIVPGAILK